MPAGQARLSLLLACYAMFGISLIASVVIITQLWQRLVRHSVGPAALIPTLWIVLGPLGQSVTAPACSARPPPCFPPMSPCFLPVSPCFPPMR